MTYSEHFINNFYLSSLISLVFIIYLFIKAFLISSLIKQSRISFLDEFANIIVFFLILSIYTSVFNLLLIFKSIYLIKYLLVISLLTVIFCFYYYNKKKLLTKKNINLNILKRKNIILALLLLSLFLISILPLSDADSIAYHLNFPFRLMTDGFIDSDIQKNLMFSVFANNEIILTLSVLLKSDNFGSILNYLTLIFFMICQKKSKYFNIILLSCPLLIFLISTQKLQLVFAILFLILFINIYERKLKTDLEIFIVCTLLAFYASIKTSYILISFPLFVYLIFNYNSKLLKILIYSSIGFLLFFVPLFLIKYNVYNNIFAPFFDNYLGDKNEAFEALQYSLRRTEGWIENIHNYKVYLKIFIPTNLSQLSATYGLLFLVLFFNYDQLKKLNFFPFVIVFMILITGQILPRYYLEAFLILAYYLSNINLFTKLIAYSQLSMMVVFSSLFIYNSYDGFLNKNFKQNYQEKFAFSYYNSEQVEKLNFNNKNVLTFADGRQSIFYSKNFYSQRYLSVLSSYKENNILDNFLPKYIKDNDIEYIIHTDLKGNNCLDLTYDGFLNQKKAVRNFLIKNDFIKHKIYKIQNIKNC